MIIFKTKSKFCLFKKNRKELQYNQKKEIESFMKKCLLIINPASGQKKIKRKAVDVLEILNRAGWETHVFITLKRNDAKHIVKEYGQQAELIVCCGGDGTLNEVADAHFQSELTCPVGYIPCGTTNDFAGSMHLPLEIEAATRSIVNGREVKRDLGIFNGRVFTYIASFGIFSEASYNAPQSIKNIIGGLAYILEGVKDIVAIKSIHMKIEADEGIIEDDFLFGAIGNTTSIGGILKLNQDKVCFNDGKMELLLIKMPKNLIELRDLLFHLRKGDYEDEHILFAQSSEFKITTEHEIPYTLDGEYAGAFKDVDIQTKQNGITFLIEEEI